MANELTLSGSLDYEDSEGSAVSLAISNLLATVTTKRFTWTKQNIGITEEAINLGDVTAPGYCVFVNRDSTNFIELRVATGGAKFAKLRAGEFCLLRLGSGAQIPYAIADTATCQMELCIIST